MIDRLQRIAGEPHVRAARSHDLVRGVSALFVVEPGTPEEVAEVLHSADEAGLAVVPRGGGTKLEWGNPPARVDLILSTARLANVVEHAWADMTVTVEAGCTVAALQDTLARHGQRLAIDPLWPEWATVGGILSTNDSGVLRLRYGGLRDLVIGMTLALADGTLAASGGKVVKNVAGYDLPKLATGALGTLGVITRATFRLHPLPHHTRTVSVQASTPETVQMLLDVIQDSTLAHAALQVRIGPKSAPLVDVLLEGTEAGIAAQALTFEALAKETTSIAAIDPWVARQDLWPLRADTRDCIVAKVSMLPSRMGVMLEKLAGLASEARWTAVLQATGLGNIRIEAGPTQLSSILPDLRAALEADGGSLVILRQPENLDGLDAWGNPGDALPLMRALKRQFDPRGTLNPGRFWGGI